jgi:hypothetical protein
MLAQPATDNPDLSTMHGNLFLQEENKTPLDRARQESLSNSFSLPEVKKVHEGWQPDTNIFSSLNFVSFLYPRIRVVN